MVDRLLQLIDEIIRLKTIRTERQRRVFAELYQPIFNDLVTIHADYVTMFRRAAKAMEEGGLGNAIEVIQDSRIKYEAVRDKVRAVAAATGQRKLGPDETEFWNALERYFGDLEIGRAGMRSHSGELLARLELLHDALDAGESERMNMSALMDLREATDILRLRWAIICERFAALQLSAYSN